MDMQTGTENDGMLAVQDLTVRRPAEQRLLTLVEGVSFTVREGEWIGLAGESGSGKTLTALAVMGLLTPDEGWAVSGRIRFRGTDLSRLSGEAWKRIRGRKMAMIFQDPMNALNPVMSCGWQIAEVYRNHFSFTRSEARLASLRLLKELEFGQPSRAFSAYPHELSGGMRQRILTAMAIAGEPALIIADEPTSMLDPENERINLRLIRDHAGKNASGLILITHDLTQLAGADRIIVMYAARIVETGTPQDIQSSPQHPYTVKLLELSGRPVNGRLPTIPGTIPVPEQYQEGCRFSGRCVHAMGICAEGIPPLKEISPGHYSACWLNKN